METGGVWSRPSTAPPPLVPDELSNVCKLIMDSGIPDQVEIYSLAARILPEPLIHSTDGASSGYF